MTYGDEKNASLVAKYQQFKENTKGSVSEKGLKFHERQGIDVLIRQKDIKQRKKFMIQDSELLETLQESIEYEGN